MPDRDVPVGKEYDGPSGIGRDSTWLTAEDLIEGKDLKVQIEKVVLYPSVKFQGGRVRENMIGLQFKGKARVLGLNATNRKVLNKMFGSLTRGWKGQQITLFVSETQMAGETVKCVRIRNTGSRVATAAEQFLHDEDAPMVAPGDTAFERAAEMAGMTEETKQALLDRFQGDHEAAHAHIAEQVANGGLL